jgi:hypothetical protein
MLMVLSLATLCPAQTNCDITTEAKELLNSWASSIAATEKIGFNTESGLTVTIDGQDRTTKMGYTVFIERPDHLAMRSVSARDGVDTIIDGKQLLRIARLAHCYSIQSAPSRLDKAFRRDGFVDPLSEWFMPVICSRDAPQSILNGIRQVRELEKLELDGVQCRQLKFQAGDSVWTLALLPDSPPIVRQLSWTFPKSTRVDGRVTIQFKSWDFQPKFDADTFKITQPAGYTKVENALEN